MGGVNPVQQAIESLAFASTPPEGRRPGCGHERHDKPVAGAREHTGSRRHDPIQSCAMTSALNGSPASRVAIITGGSRGVGGATVRRLSARGYVVVVNYLHDQYLHDQRAAELIVEAVLGG